jgi:hypothetical protein
VYRITLPKCLAFGVAVFLLLPSKVSYSQEMSWQSVNFPDRFIRHRNFLGFVEPVNDQQAGKDANFVSVPGLAGKCHSYESKNFPGFFLRHENFRVKLSKSGTDQLSRDDATFCAIPGLANTDGRSLESVNFPNHFIRHRDFELVLSPNDGSDLFKKDATFMAKGPFQTQ